MIPFPAVWSHSYFMSCSGGAVICCVVYCLYMSNVILQWWQKIWLKWYSKPGDSQWNHEVGRHALNLIPDSHSVQQCSVCFLVQQQMYWFWNGLHQDYLLGGGGGGKVPWQLTGGPVIWSPGKDETLPKGCQKQKCWVSIEGILKNLGFLGLCYRKFGYLVSNIWVFIEAFALI